MKDEDFLSVETLAKRLNLSKKSVYHYAATGALPFYELGKHKFFVWSEVVASMKTPAKRESKELKAKR